MDTFARIGGEEFAFLFRKCHQNDAGDAVARLRDEVLAVKKQSRDLEFPITFSAGVAEVRIEDKSFDDTIHRVDQALHRAKELGRNRMESISKA